MSPAGTKEKPFFRSSLRDSNFLFGCLPPNEFVGYLLSSLRDFFRLYFSFG